MLPMDTPVYRNRLAVCMMVSHEHLFPGTNHYWRYRTIRRLLTTRLAADLGSGEIEVLPAPKPGWKAEEHYMQMALYEGLLELMYGQGCYWRIMKAMDHLTLGNDDYIWTHVNPDVVRSGCGFLMAHKEPFVRVRREPEPEPVEKGKEGNIIDLCASDEVSDEDPWGIPEFDGIDDDCLDN